MQTMSRKSRASKKREESLEPKARLLFEAVEETGDSDADQELCIHAHRLTQRDVQQTQRENTGIRGWRAIVWMD